MANVVYAPEAESDILNIADVIARDKPNAARNWVTKLRATCDTLSTQPNVGEMRAEFSVLGCRSLSFGNDVCSFVRSKMELKWLGWFTEVGICATAKPCRVGERPR